MIEPAVVPARTLSSPGGAAGCGYRPWLEVAARVHVTVDAWDVREDGWLHWAAPCRGGRVALEDAGRAWPGRRAGWAGQPPPDQRLDAAPADEEAVKAAGRALWLRWRPELFRHGALGAVSSIGEDRESFRRRCLSGFGEALRHGRLGREDAPALAALASAVEARTLAETEYRAIVLRAGVCWYPDGTAPEPAPDDLMAGGGVRARG